MAVGGGCKCNRWWNKLNGMKLYTQWNGMKSLNELLVHVSYWQNTGALMGCVNADV